MEETSITIFHFKDFLVGFHTCDSINITDSYIQQSAGDAYNCLVRYKQLLDQKPMYVLSVSNSEICFVDVIPKSEYFERHEIQLLQEEFMVAKIDIIKVCHKNFKIDRYLPYVDVKIGENEKYIFYKLFLEMNNYKVRPITLISLIWDKIKTERIN